MRLPGWFNIRAEERAFKAYAPALWEEIGGIADGLEHPDGASRHLFRQWRLADADRRLFGGHRAVACMAATMTSGREGMRRASRSCRPRGSYASIGSSHQLTGRLDGMNEHGLTIGLHLVKARPRFPGLTSTLLVRRVLDQCATTAEAIDLLRRLPHAMQYNYSLLDAGGVAAVVEAGAGAVVVAPWRLARLHQSFPVAATEAFEPPRRALDWPAAAAGNWAARRL